MRCSIVHSDSGFWECHCEREQMGTLVYCRFFLPLFCSRAFSISQIFGMNMYQPYGHNDEYTGNYTIGRMGGNAQTRFNYKINAQNSGHDYYFINQASDFTWQQFYSTASKSGLSFWTQIPAMGMKDDYSSWYLLHLFGEYISLFVYIPLNRMGGWIHYKIMVILSV